MSGLVLTHWSRRRDINVTVIGALAAGNSLALAEIARNMGQQQPGHLVIQEGNDQNIIMAQMEDLLLLLAIGANASLGWSRIATLRTIENVLRIARSESSA
jgi:predicted regulator of Ras-like GTPase activity (Roadblock/LC7/MglB family)